MKYKLTEIYEAKPIKAFCYLCGEDSEKIVVLKVVCANCTAPINVNLCQKCAKTLLEELEKIIR